LNWIAGAENAFFNFPPQCGQILSGRSPLPWIASVLFPQESQSNS
jgi:hypothetical protein